MAVKFEACAHIIYPSVFVGGSILLLIYPLFSVFLVPNFNSPQDIPAMAVRGFPCRCVPARVHTRTGAHHEYIHTGVEYVPAFLLAHDFNSPQDIPAISAGISISVYPGTGTHQTRNPPREYLRRGRIPSYLL